MRASRLLVVLIVIVVTIALVAACGSSKTSDTHHKRGGNTKTVVTVVNTVTAPAPTVSTATQTTTTGTSTAPPTTTQTTASSTSSDCNVTDLAAAESAPNGAAGTQILTFTLTNTGASACDTYGWPGIGFLSAAGTLLPTTPARVTRDALGSTGAPIRLSLSPGQQASFRVTVSLSGSGASCVNAPKIEITPPNDKPTLTLKLKSPQPTCGKATVTPLLPGTSATPAGT